MTHRRKRGSGDQRGEAIIETLLLLAGALLPLLALIGLTARLELARLGVDQTARDAARAASQAATSTAATAAAQSALRRAQQQSPNPLTLTLRGQLVRGAAFTATVTTTVNLAGGPDSWLGSFASVRISGHATIPVDQYRSLP